MNERRKLGEQSIGAVIAYRPSHSLHKQFVLLKSPRGDWNFVKGHEENQETDHDTLKREIFEETGITSFNIFNYLGNIKYKIMKAGLPVQKEVKFYYVTTDHNQVILSNEHVDYIWVYYEQARKLLTFSQSNLILEKIMNTAYCMIKCCHEVYPYRNQN
ncbi:MAG: NUDIX domain-containing protein [Nitrososphaeraceae archaeon]|nr:NUDIX domain-containing protein [Nitrososphaeraceae archaeon]